MQESGKKLQLKPYQFVSLFLWDSLIWCSGSSPTPVMSILSTNEGLLTNAEVLQILSTSTSEASKGSEHIETMVHDALEKRCQLTDLSTLTQLLHDIRALDLHLTEAEMLMLANLTPTNAVEIHLVGIFPPYSLSAERSLAQIVEDCAERLSDEQVDQIIAVIQRLLPTSAMDTSE